jgi:hypothetical protein
MAVVRRNDHDGVRELIALDVRPMVLPRQGRDFGPLDDLLLIRLASSVDASGPRRLLEAFAPTPRQLVGALILGCGPAVGRWAGLAFDEGVLAPVAGLTLAGAGMTRLPVIPQTPPTSEILDRWSRTRGALGDAVWHRLRSARVAVIGAGRNGSARIQHSEEGSKNARDAK